MSTSPSWFDHDKFSNLLKKVGPVAPSALPTGTTPPQGFRTQILKMPRRPRQGVTEGAASPPGTEQEPSSLIPRLKIPPRHTSPPPLRAVPPGKDPEENLAVAVEKTPTGMIPLRKTILEEAADQGQYRVKLEDKLARAQLEVRELRGLLEERDQALKKMEEAREHFAQQVLELTNEIEEVRKEIRLAQELISEQEKRTTRQQEERGAEFNLERTALQEAIAAGQKKLEAEQRQAEIAAENLKELGQRRAFLQKVLEESEQENLKKTQQLEKIEAELDLQRMHVIKADLAREEFLQSREEETRALQQAVEKAEQEKSDLGQEIKGWREQSAQAENEIKLLRSRLDATTEEQAEGQRILEETRQLLAQKEEQLESASFSASGLDEVLETYKQESNAAQVQLGQSQEETSQLRLELEQVQIQATDFYQQLQTTHQALEEAQQAVAAAGTGSKSQLENLQRECSTLVQQNMMLQAQFDQVQRELSSAKAKLSARNA